jgi:hypothetical protein
VRVDSAQVALETDLAISYSIDNFDPTRFNDIHCLLYAGAALLYAVRVAGEAARLTVPCGVITHAGPHSLSLQHTNNTVIAAAGFPVSWPLLAVSAPRRLETFTTAVTVRVAAVRNQCRPLAAGPGLLQGGAHGLPTLWLRLQLCGSAEATCPEPRLVLLRKLADFYVNLASEVRIGCQSWGLPGTYRVEVGAELGLEREAGAADRVVATSAAFRVERSSEYRIVLHRPAVAPCLPGLPAAAAAKV